jgi:hypothetical protein
MHDADLTLQTIAPDNLACPTALNVCAAFRTAPTLNAIGNLESSRGTFPAACSERIGLQSKSAVWEQNDLHTPSACGGVVDF